MSRQPFFRRLSNWCMYSRNECSARVSVIGGFLIAGNQRTTEVAPKNNFTKGILYTHFVIYLESKRKRHMKQWTELWKLGLSPHKTEILVDFLLYAGRRSIKSPVCPTTLSILQPTRLIWKHCTVTTPLGFTMTSTECLWAHSCVYELVKDVVCWHVWYRVCLITVTEYICILVRDAE